MTSFYEELHKHDSISDENENAQSRATVDKWIFRLLLVLISVMPLIVLANVKEVVSPLVSNVDVLSSGTKGDLFTHYKLLFLIVITVITGAMQLIKVFFMGGSIKKTWINYVLGIFVVSVILSTVFSPNISIALNGQYNRSDGAISWLCYLTLLFIAMNIEYPKKIVTYIMYSMIPFVFINFYIIMMNFYGKDLLQNYVWVQKLVSITLPEGANISEGSVLVGTLNQWNYMSGMFAMMTVMYLAWAVLSNNWIETIIGAVTASVSIAVMFMSVSTSGFLTVLVILILIIVNMFRVEKKIQSIVAMVIFLLFSIPVFNTLSERNEKVWQNSFGFFIDKNPHHPEYVSTLGKDNLAFASDNIITLPELPERDSSAGSGRVYIWDKTLSLVKERLIVGYGADSLTYNFPHYNIDARSGLMDENIIVDKPHNTFIGTLYGFGIFGLIALLILLMVVGLKTFKSIFNKSHNEFILAITVLAYFAQAMFNDSLPSISSISFIFIGILLTLEINKSKEINLNGRNN